MSSNDHLMPHSPQRNYPHGSRMSLGSSSGSDSHDSESNVSEMMVDVESKFANIKGKHRKSIDADFEPASDASSKSDSESVSGSESVKSLCVHHFVL